jgi:hypothetical protein
MEASLVPLLELCAGRIDALHRQYFEKRKVPGYRTSGLHQFGKCH